MAPVYSSFLVRWWTIDGAAARIEVEHIQSGARTRVATSAQALAWMVAHAGDATAGADPMTGPGPRRDQTGALQATGNGQEA